MLNDLTCFVGLVMNSALVLPSDDLLTCSVDTSPISMTNVQFAKQVIFESAISAINQRLVVTLTLAKRTVGCMSRIIARITTTLQHDFHLYSVVK